MKLMHHMPRGDVLHWRTEIPADLGVNMDPNDFGEVMGNLLDNARKWAKTCVTIQVSLREGKALICIEDDGPGFLSPDDNAFPVRGITGSADPDSTGLGLGIVEDVLSEYDTAPVIHRSGRASVSFEIPICSQPPPPAKEVLSLEDHSPRSSSLTQSA
jgi:signal transduction histidine kinase